MGRPGRLSPLDASAAPPPVVSPPPRSPRPAVALASFGHALCHGSKLLLPLVQVVAAAELGVDLPHLALAMSAFSLSMGLASVPAGLLSDRLGPTRLLVGYFALLAVAAAGCALAPGYGSFVAAQAALGAAAGLYHPPGLALISFSTDRRTMGPAMGWHGVASSVGIALAPLGILALRDRWGWRSAFVALAFTAALAALAAAWLRASGHVLAGRPAPDVHPPARRVRRRGLFVLLLAMSANGFLMDGFSALFPVTVAQRSTLAADDAWVVFGILALGGLGQLAGGRLAKGTRDRASYLALVAMQPMAFAGVALLLAAPTVAFALLAAFAFANFATQPIENRIMAEFTSGAKRGTAYALKFLVALVVGAAAPPLVMTLAEQRGQGAGFWALAAASLVALLGVGLFLREAGGAPPAAAAAG